MRRLKINGKLSITALEERYREAKDPVARSQWQIVWLLASGQTSEAVAQVTGYSTEWIRTIARRYNAEGAAGIGDRRHGNPGRASQLTAHDQQRLKAEIIQSQAQGERWTGPRVAQWMSQRLGQAVYPQRGWEMLRKLGFTAQTPRPRHRQAQVGEQQVFKKCLAKG